MLAPSTRVCSYDHPNRRWSRSQPGPTPRSGREVVADLHAALAAARVPGPYVLAGHSNGGLFAQLYAATHPGEVAGLVLVDAVHPEYYERRRALFRSLIPPAEADAAVDAALALRPAAVDPEQLDLAATLGQVKAAWATSPLPPIPLVVLSHGKALGDSGPGSPVEADERLWAQLQAELTRLVPGGRHVVAEQSGHDIPSEQPESVVEAIGQVVSAVRQPRG